ncbi:MAG TPA: hypothetical protein VFR23_20775 [Jiangellaceae bacterium]|nr:hypothetical protein [Jiangellaceae bacterium]
MSCVAVGWIAAFGPIDEPPPVALQRTKLADGAADVVGAGADKLKAWPQGGWPVSRRATTLRITTAAPVTAVMATRTNRSAHRIESGCG